MALTKQEEQEDLDALYKVAIHLFNCVELHFTILRGEGWKITGDASEDGESSSLRVDDSWWFIRYGEKRRKQIETILSASIPIDY